MTLIDLLKRLFGVGPKPVPAPVPPQVPPVTPPTDWRVRLLTLHNAARADQKARALVTNALLQQAAQQYANWLAANLTLPADHRGPGGNTMGGRLAQAGYAWTDAGENIAKGQPDADSVFRAWTNSPGHYRNIVNPKFSDWGAGVAYGTDGRMYWCCDFATPLQGRLQRLVYLWCPPGLETTGTE